METSNVKKKNSSEPLDLFYFQLKDGLMDFKEYFSEIRAKIGYCASTDVLYNYLTVEETLRLIGEIKGVQRDQLNLEINDLYEKVKTISVLWD